MDCISLVTIMIWYRKCWKIGQARSANQDEYVIMNEGMNLEFGWNG